MSLFVESVASHDNLDAADHEIGMFFLENPDLLIRFNPINLLFINNYY